MLDIIKQYAITQPEIPALIHGKDQLSYSELYRKSLALALWLRHIGVCPEDRVVVAARRGIDTALTFYAILWCGATYVPLEHSYPTERIAALIEEISPRVALLPGDKETSLHCRLFCPGSDIQDITVAQALEKIETEGLIYDELPKPCDDRLAYIMFTSGSTGRPKGVCITRRSIFSFINKYCRAMEYEKGIKMLGITSLSGDGSMIQHLCVHHMGGTLYVYDYRLPCALINFLARHEITDIDCSATLVKIMTSPISGLNNTPLPALRRISYGGDSLPIRYIKDMFRLLPHVKIYNGYGPTECTVLASLYLIDASLLKQEDDTPVPIGRPLPGVIFLIVDENDNPVSKGEIGELLIGGDQVMSEYFRDPSLTGSSIVEIDGEHYYRTADLVSIGIDGNYLFNRRKNDMLKIRGFRIFPSEIENEIRQVGRIKDCFIIKNDSQETLRAFLVLEPGRELDLHKLRQRLSRKLPQYMIPSSFTLLESFPVRPNGKIDREALARL